MHAVRCTRCGNWSRVRPEMLGKSVSCPSCAGTFHAEDPVVSRSTQEPALPKALRVDLPVQQAEPQELLEFSPSSNGPSPFMIALIVMPALIPPAWAAASIFLRKNPIFSYAAPVSVTLCLVGLGLGLGFLRELSARRRIVLLMLLLVMGCSATGVLFHFKKEWGDKVAERVRAMPMFGARSWLLYHPEDGAYEVRFPGRIREENAAEPLPGWNLTARRLAFRRVPDGRLFYSLVYVSAHGTPPAEVIAPDADDDTWFQAAKNALVQATEGTIVSEQVVKESPNPAREYELSLGDTSTRFVRIYRKRTEAFYLGVEGPFINRESDHSKKFFDSFRIDPFRKVPR